MKIPEVDLNTLGEIPSVSIISQLDAYRKYGESLFDTAERIILVEALRVNKSSQACAADTIGCTRRVMNYKLRAFGVRPTDIRTDDQDEE